MINATKQDLLTMKYFGRRFLWKPFLKRFDCQNICELGVREGQNFFRMIEHGPKLAVAVDVWKDDGVHSRNDIFLSQEQLEKQCDLFHEWAKDKPFVTIHREYTFDAASHYPDNYFDAIYVDADHSYEGVKRDLEAWYPKIKSGRFMIGDDYRNVVRRGVRFEVVRAVNEFCQKNNLDLALMTMHNWGIIKP